jgi:hypothetical protein
MFTLANFERTSMLKKTRAEQRSVHHRQFRPLLFCFTVIVLALALACSRTAEKPATTTANNDPDQLLRQMSEKLAQAKNLSFKVERQLDAALVDGRNIPESSVIEISVSRPGSPYID